MSGLQGDLFDDEGLVAGDGGLGRSLSDVKDAAPSGSGVGSAVSASGAGRAADAPVTPLEVEAAADHPDAIPLTPLTDESITADAFAPADLPLVLGELSRWAEAGWLRRLDSAFARFIADLAAGNASPLLVFAAALTAHMEGRGHACLDLDQLLMSGEALLGWKPEGAAAMAALSLRLPADSSAWRDALIASPLVRRPDTVDRNEPLVLDGARLYLRRYFLYESRVADSVALRARPAPLEVLDARHGLVVRGVDLRKVRDALDALFAAPAASSASASASASASPSSSSSPSPSQTDWQRIACAVALRGGMSIITGGPGTGKTYTVARLLALLFAIEPEPEKMRVAVAAPTGKAAARLKQSIDSALNELELRVGETLPVRALAQHIGAARTLHSLLGARGDTRHFTHNAANPLDVDVLVVDEASMVHLEMMDSLLAALPPQARLILLGDKDQLASVEAGAVLGDLCLGAEAGHYDAETDGYVRVTTGQSIPAAFLASPADEPPGLSQQTVMLRESRRFGGAIGQLPNAVNAGDIAGAHAAFGQGAGTALRWMANATAASVVELALQGREGAPGGYRPYLQGMKQRPGEGTPEHEGWVRSVLGAFEKFRVLCAVRDGDWGVNALNTGIEQALSSAGLLSLAGEWYEGRPVLVTRNDYAAGVFNGDVGIALRPPGARGSLRVYFPDGEQLRSVMASRLADVETAFAMTVHKSQGSEFDHTVLALPEDARRVLTRELVYTGITRARSAFTLVTPKGDAFAQALAQRTMRASGLPGLLAAAQARRRQA